MINKECEALITLVAGWLPALSVEQRKEFLQKLRNGWCERCGRTENALCRAGTCS